MDVDDYSDGLVDAISDSALKPAGSSRSVNGSTSGGASGAAARKPVRNSRRVQSLTGYLGPSVVRCIVPRVPCVLACDYIAFSVLPNSYYSLLYPRCKL